MNNRTKLAKKEIFAMFQTKQIESIENFISVVDTIKEILTKYDGKIVNSRLKKLLTETLVGKFFTELQRYSSSYGFVGKTDFRIIFRVDGHGREVYYDNGETREFLGYIENYDKFIVDILVNEDDRLLATDTIAKLDEYVEKLDYQTDELNNELANYDSYMEDNREILKLIEEYQNKVPYALRHNIRVERNFNVGY